MATEDSEGATPEQTQDEERSPEERAADAVERADDAVTDLDDGAMPAADVTADAEAAVPPRPESLEEPEAVPVASSPEDAEVPAAPALGEVAATEGEAEGEVDETGGLTLGEGAPAQPVDPDWRPVIRGRVDRFGVAMGTGRRKTSVARVRVKEGDGKISINGRALDEYFSTDRDRLDVVSPLKATDTEGKLDVWVRVHGGGTTGQSGAILLGIARALQAVDPNHHHALAEGGFLTRDQRMVERKKYGLKKARKSFQFSKR